MTDFGVLSAQCLARCNPLSNGGFLYHFIIIFCEANESCKANLITVLVINNVRITAYPSSSSQQVIANTCVFTEIVNSCNNSHRIPFPLLIRVCFISDIL